MRSMASTVRSHNDREEGYMMGYPGWKKKNTSLSGLLQVAYVFARMVVDIYWSFLSIVRDPLEFEGTTYTSLQI